MRTSALFPQRDHTQARSQSASLATVLVVGAAAAIVVLGALLRLHALGARGFWGDEIWTAQASLPPPSDILRYYISYPGPLYYLLGHVTLAILPNAPLELALRLPSALASILCLVVFFALAWRYAGRAAALVGTLLLAAAPYQVWYAQEARFYAWSTLLALVATYALLRALDEPHKNRFWVVFGLTSVANLYNQPLSATIALIGQLVLAGAWWVIHHRPRQIVIKVLVTYAAIAASYWPIVERVSTTGRMDAFDPQTFLAYDVHDFWVTLVRSVYATIDKFAAGGLSGWLFLAFFLVGLLVTIRQRQWKLAAIVLLPLLTALLTFALGRPRTGFIVRYVLYLQPLYLLGVAVGLTAAASWMGRRIALVRGRTPQTAAWVAGIVTLGLVILLTTISLLQVRQSYAVAKINDWRAVARYLDAHIQPGDLIVGNRWFGPALSWYLQNRDQVTLSTDLNERVLEDLENGRRVWFVRLGPTQGDVSTVLKRRLPIVAPVSWQDRELDYKDDFFPASEFPVQVRFRGRGPLAVARFYDEIPVAAGEEPYRILRPGESVLVRLALPAESAARFLTITHNPHPHAALAVTIDDAEPVPVRDPEDTWQTTRLLVPDTAGDTVTVRVHNVGERADRLRQLELTYADSP